MKQIHIGNVKIDNVTVKEAVDFALMAENSPCFVVTPNAVMLSSCAKSPEQTALLNRASLSLADGMGVKWVARRQGTPICERIAGIDFGEALLERASVDGLRVFLLGGEEGIAARAAERLKARYPTLCVCGCFWGYFGDGREADERLVSVLRATRPDILFVCMGFPRQEEWIAAHLNCLSDIRVIAGLGGSLDVWSGSLKRAPHWISKMGLEWAWRIAHEPKKRLSHLPTLVRFGLFGGK